MPLIQTSSYKPPCGFGSAHLQTIYPSLFRKIPYITDRRERITTPDGDFLDLDWHCTPSNKRLAILSHGLEGHSQRAYIQGMARALKSAGWNVLAWNFRGCSGEPNQVLDFYHSGSIGDLQTVIAHAAADPTHQEIALIGFSLGGNITLKLLGDYAAQLDPKISAAVTFSVTCDLSGSAVELAKWQNGLYMRRFLKTLREKIEEKALRFPGKLALNQLDTVQNFQQFDEHFTAPVHGYKNAEDYWAQCSSLISLPNIRIPTLLVNAIDDPFLGPKCYPRALAAEHPYFHLETPTYGGHMGFVQFNHEKQYWSEMRALEFLSTHTRIAQNP